MITGLAGFSLLWITSCVLLYFGLQRKNEEALQKNIEANRLCTAARQKHAQAQKTLDEAVFRLQQIEQSLNCPN